MDLFALEGLWTNFISGPAARGKGGYGIYYWLAANAQKRIVKATEPKRAALDRSIAKAEAEETTDLAIFLAEI